MLDISAVQLYNTGPIFTVYSPPSQNAQFLPSCSLQNLTVALFGLLLIQYNITAAEHPVYRSDVRI